MTQTDQHALALVTGASSGIGAELARALARRKIDLVLTARREDRLEKLKAELMAEHGIEATVIAHDLGVPGGAESLCEEIARRALKITILINNAGFGWYGDFEQQKPEDISTMLQLNVVTLTTLTRLLGAEMAKRGKGRILNVSSMIGFTPASQMALYSGTKAYVTALSQALDVELRDQGIRVCVICPGFTATEFNDVADWPKSRLMNLMMLKATHVAEEGVARLLQGKRVIIPGWHFRLTAFVIRFLPRSLMLKLAAMFVQSPETHEESA